MSTARVAFAHDAVPPAVSLKVQFAGSSAGAVKALRRPTLSEKASTSGTDTK